MSEIGTATLSPPSGPNRIGSVGRLCPGFSASLRHVNGTEVAAGVEGRLWIQAPSRMVGYWDNPKATAEILADGWLDTGDEMRIDADGYVWFCGRRKQIIVHDGSNICPQEVEEALAEHAAGHPRGCTHTEHHASEDSQRLLLAVPGTDVHPARWTRFAVGGRHLVVDR
ncbi:MAG: hypothetical protein ACKO8I_06625 [Cyanobacteriota bacterium]